MKERDSCGYLSEFESEISRATDRSRPRSIIYPTQIYISANYN